MFRCLIFLIFLFGILPVFCQEPEYIHFTVEDGLPSSQVYDIIQDAEGYMWFATDNGVCRYDGSEFIIYTTDDGLPANIVFEIYPDQQGRIWFIGPGCLLSFYEKGHVTPFAFNKEILREFKGGILPIKKTFRIDESGKIFLSIMGKGNMIVYPDGKIIGNFPGGSTRITVLKDTITILSPCEFNDGKIYADYFGERDTIIYPRLEKSFSNEVFFDFYRKGMLVTMNNRILFYRGKNDYNYMEFHKRIIYYLKTGNEIWLGFLHGGAACYNNATFSSVPDIFLEDKSISSIFRDKENGYWFASLNDGVFYSPTLHVKSFKNNGVGDLAVMDNSLIFCDLPDKIYRLKKNPEPLLSFPGNVIGPVYYNHADASLYIGTGDMLAIYKDRQTRIIKNFYFETDGLLHKMVIRHISGLNNGKVLLSTYSRYYVFDGKTLGIMKIPIADENLHDLTIHEGRDGVHWIGAKTGLYSRKGETDYFYGKEYPVLSHAINTITDFKNGLLIGTEDTGLVFFDGKTCRTTSRINGITDNAVTCIAIDRQERIWAGTKNGLNRINWDVNELDNPDVFRITRMHGLVSGEINDLVIINDTLYVSTGSGLSIFSIHDLHPDTVSSPPLIKAIRIADKDTVISNFYILNYNQNFINIQFTGLDFNKQTTRLFKYRLIRYNTPTQWEYTTSSYARFTYLPPGDYCFELYASNKDGYWSHDPVKIYFLIKMPFWKTWWFYGLISLAIILIVSQIYYIIHTIRIKELEKRNALAQEMIRYQQQALTQQMNPHFIFNTLNSIQYYIYKNDKDASNQYLSMFSKLMRKTLDNSQKSTIPLQDELEVLELYLNLEKFRHKEKFSYKIEVDKSMNKNELYIPTLILQPYLENAIWHGIANKEGPGYVYLNIQLKEKELFCSIEDNGVGREKAMQIKQGKTNTYTSLGTSITEARLKLITGLYGNKMYVNIIDLFDQEGRASGTRVELTLPVLTHA